MKTIVIEFPADADGEEIKEILFERIDELRPAMDFSDAMRVDRAEVDSVELDEIDFDGDGVSIEYSYEYSAYYGCDDANVIDGDSGVIIGRRVGNTLVFDEFIYPPVRTTLDEF